MLCPRCGAYSPHNTAVCNRCGAKLTGDPSGEQPRSRKYYRNARKSDLENAIESLQTKANDTLDSLMATRKGKIILIAVAAAAVISLIGGTVGCFSCACDSCTSTAASNSDISADAPADESESVPQEIPISGTDITSGSDYVSGSVVSSSDVSVTEDSEPADDMLVSITRYIPSLYVDLKYATTDNFTGKVIYDFKEPRLRYGTVKKLAAVQEELVSLGYSLIVWDAYRPMYAQEALWEAFPDPAYISDPATGYCSHSRGNTVDITLTVIANGKDVEMPSGFDEFSALANRDYSDVSSAAAANSAMLEDIMTAHGFNGYSGEWWHYSDTVEYPVIEG